MMAVKDYTQINHYWSEFTSQKDIFSNLSLEDVHSFQVSKPEIGGKCYKADMQLIVNYLTPKGSKKLANRFKNWKTRQIHQKTSITISKSTLARLQVFAELSGFSEDNYDLAFEFLLDPSESLEMNKIKHRMSSEVKNLPSLAQGNEVYQYLAAKLKSSNNSVKYLNDALEITYTRAWDDCITTVDGADEIEFSNALMQFLSELKSPG